MLKVLSLACAAGRRILVVGERRVAAGVTCPTDDTLTQDRAKHSNKDKVRQVTNDWRNAIIGELTQLRTQPPYPHNDDVRRLSRSCADGRNGAPQRGAHTKQPCTGNLRASEWRGCPHTAGGVPKTPPIRLA